MRAAAIISILLLAATPVLAAWNPQGWERAEDKDNSGAVNPGAVVLGGALALYRNWVSPVDGSRCPSYPSCSAYSKEAIHRHGPLAGAALTAARLISEGDEAAFAPRILVGGQFKVYYPVEKTFILDGNAHE